MRDKEDDDIDFSDCNDLNRRDDDDDDDEAPVSTSMSVSNSSHDTLPIVSSSSDSR